MKTLTAIPGRQRGALMIEVLITIVIVLIGALGLIQMQSRLQKSEVESYQRTQAMILVNDMANRISANRANADSYLTAGLDPAFLGGTADDWDCGTIGTADLTETDYTEWCEALQGAGEAQGGSSVGALIGGRGCVQSLGTNQYLVSVVWQGMTPISAPPANVSCGANLYDDATTDCVNDLCRRYVTTVVRLADLDL